MVLGLRGDVWKRTMRLSFDELVAWTIMIMKGTVAAWAQLPQKEEEMDGDEMSTKDICM